MAEFNVGVYIRKWRKIRNVTLQELGQRVELSHPYLSQIENNKREASPEILKKIAEALDISYGDLMTIAGYWSDEDSLESVAELKQKLNQMENQRSLESIAAKIDLSEYLKQSSAAYNSIILTKQDKKLISLFLDALFQDRT